jgi:isopentenyl-diphosphate delta-isomerase
VELLDILTPDGLPTDRVKAKPDVHRDGDWHRAAHVWLVARDGRVLLQRRASIKENWPDFWDISVAGHVAAGESAIDTAIREAQEELGVTLSAAELTYLGTLRYHAVLNDGAYIENEFHDVFIAMRDVDLDELVLEPAEVADVALVQPDDIARYDVVPHDEEYALLFAYLNASRSSRT